MFLFMKSEVANQFFLGRSLMFAMLSCLAFANNLQAQNCASTNLGEAAPFALFTFSNFSSTQADQTWGRVAVGGNFTVSNWGIGANSCLTNAAARYDLVVAGNLSYNGGQVNNGSVAYGGTLIASPTLATAGATISKTTIVNFATTQSSLRTKSGYWSTLATTGSIANDGYGNITLTGSNSSLNVFNLTASTIQAYSYLNISINVPNAATVLINVSGSLTNMPQITTTYNSTQLTTGIAQANYQGCPQSRILWNLGSSTTSFTMSSVGFQGTLLAPWANVSASQGEINGQLIVNSVSQLNSWAAPIQVHCTLFQGCLTEPPSCTISAGANQTICAGNSATLTGTSPTTGTWSSLSTNPTGFTLGSTTNGVATVSFRDTITTRNFSFIYSNSTCSDTMLITVNALPVISSIQGDTIIIVDDSVTFTNVNAGGVWTSTNTAAATLSSSNGKGQGKGQGNTKIQYTITNANGCSRTVERNVRVAPKVRS